MGFYQEILRPQNITKLMEDNFKMNIKNGPRNKRPRDNKMNTLLINTLIKLARINFPLLILSSQRLDQNLRIRLSLTYILMNLSIWTH
jgi:hypothetical protein